MLVEVDERSTLLLFDNLFLCLKFSFTIRRLVLDRPLKDFLIKIGKILPEGPDLSSSSLAIRGVEEASGEEEVVDNTRLLRMTSLTALAGKYGFIGFLTDNRGYI